jgi:hypothetical protein
VTGGSGWVTLTNSLRQATSGGADAFVRAGPYGVALVRGHQKATVDVGVLEKDGEPAATLHGLGFVD